MRISPQPVDYEQRWRADFGKELQRASQMGRKFYGNFWGAPFTDRMIEFARAIAVFARCSANSSPAIRLRQSQEEAGA